MVPHCSCFADRREKSSYIYRATVHGESVYIAVCIRVPGRECSVRIYCSEMVPRRTADRCESSAGVYYIPAHSNVVDNAVRARVPRSERTVWY